MISKLEKYAANNPIYKDALLAKARLQKEKHNIIRKPEEFEKLINAVSRVLDDVEIELEHQFSKLCSMLLWQTSVFVIFCYLNSHRRFKRMAML